MHDNSTFQRLVRQAAEMRLQIVRMMGADKVHHFGGSLSAADMVSALYFYKMHYDPANPALIQTIRGVGYKFVAHRVG